MPSIKEAAVEIETSTLEPAPVTKEVTKCDVDSSLKGDGEKEVVSKSSAVVDSAEAVPTKSEPSGKAQEAEITSSAVEDKSVPRLDERETEIADSAKTTSSAAATSEEKSVDNGKCGEAEATPSEAVEAKVAESNGSASAGHEEVSTSDKEPTVVKTNEVKPEVMETSEVKSEVVKEEPPKPEPETADSTKTVTSKDVPPTAVIADSSNEAKKEETVDSDASAKVKPLEDGKMETNEDSIKSEAKKVETNSKTGDVETQPQDGGSEESAKKEETQSADSTSCEKKTDEKSEVTTGEAGSSSTAEPQPDAEAQIDTLTKEGILCLIRKNFFAAADAFGKVLELQAPLYGEMSEKLAETYFLYGTAMYEYGKSENTVLGEKVKEQEEEDEEEEGEDDEEVEGKEKMEVDESNGGDKEKDEGVGSSEKEADAAAAEATDETLAEEDDDSFRVAWEMLELAKATFQKGNNEKRLADTLMKLGEVGIETGNVEAISEMLASLEVRKKIFAANHRIIPETHFNIGVAYAFFEKYDEAVEHLKHSKACLESRIESLANSDVKEDVAEVKEMQTILPDIQEKIADTLESKADKEKIKEEQKQKEEKKPEGVVKEEAVAGASPFGSSAGDSSKPAANISHLIKRKRNVDDILPERAAKQVCQDPSSELKPTEKTAAPAESTATDQVAPAKAAPSTEGDQKPEQSKGDEKMDENN